MAQDTNEELRVYEAWESPFSPEQQEAFDYCSVNAIDIIGLERMGTVTQTRTTENGMVVVSTDYEGDNGANFTKVQSYYEKDEVEQRITEYEELIAMCVAREDYELAGVYKKELDILVNSRDEEEN